MIIDVVKVFIPPIIAFGFGIIFAPFFIKYLYKHEMWKKKSGKGLGIGGGIKIEIQAHQEWVGL
jgi:hypothetical protein